MYIMHANNTELLNILYKITKIKYIYYLGIKNDFWPVKFVT